MSNLGIVLLSALSLFGCIEDPDILDEEDFAEELDEDEMFRGLQTGMHGDRYNPNVKTGGVVNQNLVYQVSGNPNNNVFWYFCGQSATSTALNFERGSSLSSNEKVTQLNWFHERLKVRQWDYNNDNPNSVGSYETRIDWLWNLMKQEKVDEFTTTSYVTATRDNSKSWMHSQLDSGAIVVALTQTNNNYGHFVAIYAIDYQPNQYKGGRVYYGDPLLGGLDWEYYSDFLDDMEDASAHDYYNTFSVKKK